MVRVFLNCFQLALALMVLSGCASHVNNLSPLLEEKGAYHAVISTYAHPLFTVDNNRAMEEKRLWIFIEGDGRAWLNRTTPGTDPTPRLRDMILRAIDFREAAIYMARPCQYVRGPDCKIKVWTQDRFSDEIIASYDEALNTIKEEKGADSFILVGYSGGAAIAMKLAARRDDIQYIQTIAGNLDPLRWVEHHGLSEIVSSPFSEMEVEKLRSVKQRHFIGSNDMTIPGDLTRSIIDEMKPDCVGLVEINTDHSNWDMLLNSELLEKLSCITTPEK